MSDQSQTRVRFAPSPTGYLHVGGARTAVFNYLFARRSGGCFILRIEDTDRERSDDAMTRAIVDAMEWLGLEVDEGPFHQADGLERHRAAAETLLGSGAAYRCFCTAEELEARRTGEGAAGYDGRCRAIPAEQSAARAAAGEPFAIRFRVPEGRTVWEDAVHGEMQFGNEHLEDLVLLRSDGTPVYNLAVVCDDIEMRVTHVLRGDDHISNTPKQILLYRALGMEPPVFGHLPLILGPDGKRLSKRHGATAVESYREEGILPEAMVNFLALLGWSPGDDREVMSKEELIEAFRLDRVLTKSAVFDADKLRWLNAQHLSRATAERLLPLARPPLEEAYGIPSASLEEEPGRLARVLDVVRERARDVGELCRQAAPFFAETVEYDPEAVERFWKDPGQAAPRLAALRERLAAVEPWEPGPLEEALRGLAEELEVGAGKLIHPLRVALMGLGVSPGIFTVLELMGRARSLARIDVALAWLEERAGAR